MTTLPAYVSKYFWGDDLSALSWENNQKYVTESILNKGDGEAVTWLFAKTNKEQLLRDLDTYKLDPKSANFWKIYLS